ncbi:MAG: hypothetical protein LWW86_07635 [Micrococcales bacterium]|nr:hypothetical protein [Micrococcales bacterium]
MRWERLFADLEGQLEGQARAERDAEIADRVRRERAAITLLERFALARGSRVEVVIGTGERVVGVVDDLGSDWVLLADGQGRPLLVPLTTMLGVTGLPARVADPGVSRRFGLGIALRALSRDRAVVTVTDVRGGQASGTIDGVGADALDLAEHARDEPGRSAAVRRRRTVPFSAVALVRGH